jgi:DNA repair protein RadC
MMSYKLTFRSKTFDVHDVSSEDERSARRWRPKMTSAALLYQVARPIFNELAPDQEHFVLLFATIRAQLLGHKVLSSGSLVSNIVHPAEVMTAYFRFATDGPRPGQFYLVHNHPSGNPEPSREDIDITNRIKICSDVVAVRLVDHLILGDARYFSFADAGMLVEGTVERKEPL